MAKYGFDNILLLSDEITQGIIRDKISMVVSELNDRVIERLTMHRYI